MLDKVLILELRRKNHTQVQIAEIMGVSRQRIHQILKDYISGGYRSRKKLRILNGGCKICHEKATILHHIDHNSHNNKLKNLLPVCIKCHHRLHRGDKRDTIKNFTTYICQACGKSFKRDYGSAYKGLFCSNKCKGKSMELKEKWSIKYSECFVCGRNDILHASKGMCKNCYSRYRYYKKKEEELSYL